MKAKADTKIRMTLTGAEVNIIQNLIEKEMQDDILKHNSHFWMILNGKLKNKQKKNPSEHQ